MATTSKEPSQIWNVPNQITMVRLGLSFVLFILLSLSMAVSEPTRYYCVLASFVIFIVAASTDWLDGYWARKYNQVTKLGRILDPFADKMIICGTFVLLAEATVGYPARVYGWMAVVVFAREMLVTVLRGFIESEGGDFSAKWSGKWKMLFQCIAVSAAMVMLMYATDQVPDWLWWTVNISVWVAILSTIQSGLVYIFAAAKALKA